MNFQTENSASGGQPLSFAALCKAKGFASPSQLCAALRDALPDERSAALVEALAPGGLTKVTLGGIWHGTRPPPALLLEEVEKLRDRAPEGCGAPACQPPDTTTTAEAQLAPVAFSPPADWGWDNSEDGLPVSGAEIIAEMARHLAPGELLWGVARSKDYETKWGGRPISRDDALTGDDNMAWLMQTENANYVSAGVFADGNAGKTGENQRGAVRIVLDDVGTKSKWPNLAPTMAIETSPGNHQFSYFLEGVERDLPRVEAFLNELARLGFTDPGSKSKEHYFRIPGSNVKPEHNGFRDKVRVWALERRFSLEQLAEGVGITIPAPGSVPVSAGKLTPEALLAPGADDEERGNVVARMLDCIENDGRFDSRSDWIDMLHAAHGACNGDPNGLSAFMEWSDRADDAERVWDTCKGSDRLGFSRLMGWLAEDAYEVAGQAPPPGDETDAQRQHRERAAALHRQIRFEHAVALFSRAPAVTANEFGRLEPLSRLIEAEGARRTASSGNLAAERGDDWKQALQALESARAAPSFADIGSTIVGGLLAFNPSDTRPRPIRPNITDFLTRGQVTLLYSAPAVGKSTFVAALAVALAWEKPDLLGLPGLDWAGDTMVLSNEDGHSVLMDKFTATVRSFGLTPAEQKHAILVEPRSSITLIEQVAGGAIAPTTAGIEFVKRLAERRRDSGSPHGPALLVIDTLATITAGLNENDAGAMQAAMNVLTGIARSGFLSVLVLHHTGKAAGTGGAIDMFSARGSGAIVASARMAAPMRWPTDEEVLRFGWGKTAKAVGSRYVVFDGPSGKANGIQAGLRYYERVSYSLTAWDVRETGTGGAVMPLTISVPVLKPISPQDIVRATPDQAFTHLAGRIAAEGRVRHDTGRGKTDPLDGSDTASLMGAFGMSKEEARAVVATLHNAGRVTVVMARDKSSRRDVQWLALAPAPGGEI